MDTEKARQIEIALIAKIIEGLKSGRLRAEAITDSDGDIIKAEIHAVAGDDPRRTRPLEAQRQQPGRWRKQRPL